MRIGEAATALDVPIHVLRYWDEIGVVVPDRSSSGHRDYTDEHLHRLRVLRACQEVGISLADIRIILHRGEPQRTGVIARRIEHIHEQRAQLERAEQFLAHVLTCTHDLLTRCAACSRYVASATVTARPGRK